MLGKELIYRGDLSFAEKIYVSLFGVPISGLRIRARRILPLFSAADKRILDAGCGPGVFTFELARRYPESIVVGIDIEEDLIKKDREVSGKIGRTNCVFEVQNVLALPRLEDFDVVLSVDNLEHILEHDEAMRRFYGSLKKGGRLILHVPGLYRRWYVFGWAENFYVEGHYRPGYTTEQIASLATQAGFTIERLEYTYGWIETVTNNISYWITKAEMENKYLYALVFPVLNILSWFGQWSHPKKGAGVLAILLK